MLGEDESWVDPSLDNAESLALFRKNTDSWAEESKQPTIIPKDLLKEKK